MSGFLQKIFSFKREAEQTPQEKRRMENLIRRTEKASPIAADILKQAREKGVKFKFGNLNNAYGAYSHYRNEIILSPQYPDEDLMTTLVHEGRHSLQELRLEPSQNLKTAVVVKRANEADAFAFQTAAAFEMKKTAPRAYTAFLYKYPDLMWRYEKEFYKNRRVSDGLSGAFKEWFNNYVYVEGYDRTTVYFMKLARTQRGAYRQNLNGEEVAAKICRYKGRGYLQDGFLSSRKALTVSEEIAAGAEQAEKGHIRHTLFSPKQTSADLFYVMKDNGTTALPKRREEKRNVALANAVRAAKIRWEI